MTDDRNKPVPARNLVRAFALLDLLAAHPEGLSLSEVASAAALPETTTHRLLAVLQELNVARIGDDGRWQVGRHLLELGTAYLDSVEIRSEARDLMKRLTADTGETCALGVLDDDRVVYIEKVNSPHPIRMHSAIGRSNPAVSSSLGRAILAFSPNEVVEKILADGVPRRTEQTIPSAEELYSELARCRDRGYSIDNGENESGICAAAAPILDRSNQPIAALSVAGPQQRISPDHLDELGQTTVKVAREISIRLGRRA